MLTFKLIGKQIVFSTFPPYIYIKQKYVDLYYVNSYKKPIKNTHPSTYTEIQAIGNKIGNCQVEKKLHSQIDLQKEMNSADLVRVYSMQLSRVLLLCFLIAGLNNANWQLRFLGSIPSVHCK